MWIVRLALRRPYTFVVMALLDRHPGRPLDRDDAGGHLSLHRPAGRQHRLAVQRADAGGDGEPDRHELRAVRSRRTSSASSTSNRNHIRASRVVRVFFHPTVQVDLALSQIVTQCQVQVRNMPPGTFPPQVLKYDAASVPILQLGLSSQTLKEQEIFDLGNNFIRTPLATVQGATVSYPFGGKNRQIMVDLNLDELYAKRLSPIDVSNALNLQNLIVPAGTAKFAGTEYPVRLNSSLPSISEFNNLPIKTVNGATIYMKDVATVHDGFVPQTNIVRTNGSARRPPDRHAQRQGVDAGHRQRGEGHAAQGHVDGHAGPEAVGVRRSVAVRAVGDRRRRARDADRGAADRPRHPAVPRKLAQHADRVHLDSALDSQLASAF